MLIGECKESSFYGGFVDVSIEKMDEAGLSARKKGEVVKYFQNEVERGKLLELGKDRWLSLLNRRVHQPGQQWKVQVL